MKRSGSAIGSTKQGISTLKLFERILAARVKEDDYYYRDWALTKRARLYDWITPPSDKNLFVIVWDSEAAVDNMIIEWELVELEQDRANTLSQGLSSAKDRLGSTHSRRHYSLISLFFNNLI